MIIERSMSDGWLSNTYLVAAGPGGDAFLVDAGGPVAPLLEKADEHGLTVTHVLLTHHHHDHVAELDKVLERWPDAAVLAHAEERVPGTTGELKPDEAIEIGGLTVTPLHTPGHTAGMLSLLVDGNVFTGDTLFKGSVGGVRAPGSTSYERSQALDHGRAAGSSRRTRRSARATPIPPRWPRSSSPIASCGSGVGSTMRALRNARRWVSRRR